MAVSVPALPPDRAFLDRDAVLFEVALGIPDRARPDETQIGIAGPYGDVRARVWLRSGPVHVELLRAEAVGEAAVLVTGPRFSVQLL